ncbi:MAG: FecR domain-containing protein [Pseudomonadota bacterium]
MPHDPEISDTLLEEASKLVEAAARSPASDDIDALAQWRQQSQEHEDAARAAERFHQNVSKLNHVELSSTQRMGLKVQLLSDRLGVQGVATAATAVLLLGIGFYLTSSPQPQAPERVAVATAPEPVPVQTLNTGYRQQQDFVLDDGSKLWLDWSTEVQVQMTDTQRKLTLISGRIAIAAQSDPARPLIVLSGTAQTRVTGTEFLVSYQDNLTEVSVIEGSVEVAGVDRTPVSLEAAQVVSVSNGSVGPVIIRNIGELGTWRDGMLVFRDRPLLEALDTLSTYTSFKIDTSRLWQNGDIVSGTFFIDRADDAAISIIAANRLDFEMRPQNTLIVREQRPSRP